MPPKALLLDRKKRALCRTLSNHGWTLHGLAEVFECSQMTITRVLTNKYNDNVKEDDDYIDCDTRLEYHLSSNSERDDDYSPSSSDEAETDHEAEVTRIPRTPEPELPTMSPGISKPRALSLKQRALLRILAYQKHIPSSKLAPYFKVSVGVVYSARYNHLTPKDNVEQDSAIVPVSEVKRHLALLSAASSPKRTPSSSTHRLEAPKRSRPVVEIPISSRRSIAAVSEARSNVSSRASTPGRIDRLLRDSSTTSPTPEPAAEDSGVEQSLFDALAAKSVSNLAPVLARHGVTNLQRLKQACVLDACPLRDLEVHDFWSRRIAANELTTLDFYQLRQIAMFD